MTNRKTTVKAEGKYTIEDMQKHASVASTADGLKLEGPNFKLTCLTACPDMLLFACEELAKANERVDKAEKEVARLKGIFYKWKKEKEYAAWESDTIFNALMAASKSYLVDEEGLSSKEWFEKHVEHSINKFAIENQIKALENALRENSRPIAYPHGHNTDIVYSEDIKFDIEQLRKEQE